MHEALGTTPEFTLRRMLMVALIALVGCPRAAPPSSSDSVDTPGDLSMADTIDMTQSTAPGGAVSEPTRETALEGVGSDASAGTAGESDASDEDARDPEVLPEDDAGVELPATDGGNGESDAPVLLDPQELPDIVSERVAGEHALTYEWQPWWLAPEGASTGALSIEFEVIAVTSGVNGPYEIETVVALQDSTGRFDTRFECTFEFYPPPEPSPTLSMWGTFEHAELAQQLGLPPAAQRWSRADPFRLSLVLSATSIDIRLFSLREESQCPLLRTDLTASPCGAYAHHEITQALAMKVSPDTVLTGDITPLSAIEALQEQALYLHWPDGTSTELDLAIEPGDEACMARYVLGPWPPSDVLRPPDYPEGRTMIEAAMPVVFHVESQDERLQVSLPGFVTLNTLEGDAWTGIASGVGGMSPAHWLVKRGDKVGFEQPRAGFALMLLSLTSGPHSDLSSLSLNPWDFYPGAPEYPIVHESASNRANCFGTRLEPERAAIERH